MTAPSSLVGGGKSFPSRVVLIVVLILLTTFGRIPGDSMLSATIQNSCHAPVFFVMTLLFVNLFEDRVRRYLISAGFAMVVGVLIELAQGEFGGDASPEDVVSDAIGVIASLAFHSVVTFRPPNRLHVGVVLLAALCWLSPLVLCLLAYANRALAFPTIARFSSQLDLYFINDDLNYRKIVNGPKRWRRDADHASLLATLPDSMWPGIEILEPTPDWSAYRELNIDITNPNAVALSLNVRINDQRHNNQFRDRFNRSFSIGPDQRLVVRISIADIKMAPSGRMMDLSQIRSLIIFGDANSARRSMYLNRIWLE